MERVECEGGPLDGAVIEIPDGTPEVVISIADNTWHHYVRREDASDRPIRFTWSGRR